LELGRITVGQFQVVRALHSRHKKNKKIHVPGILYSSYCVVSESPTVLHFPICSEKKKRERERERVKIEAEIRVKVSL